METLTSSRLVAPGSTRLALSDGDYLIVKHRLNAGETLDLFERAAPDVDITAPGALTHLSPARVGIGIVTAYLLDWSITDLDGAVIPIAGGTAAEKEAALRMLDFESLVEIMNAITTHDAATRQEKKARASARASSAP
jgi:hypothetical protein